MKEKNKKKQPTTHNYKHLRVNLYVMTTIHENESWKGLQGLNSNVVMASVTIPLNNVMILTFLVIN